MQSDFSPAAVLKDFIASLPDTIRDLVVARCALGRVDKRDSSGSRPMIQAHLYVGDELGTQPDIRR